MLPTREDIWGLVVNEAMACGLPVITSDKCVAGIELIENNVNGFVIPLSDTKMLSEKINKVLASEELSLKMSAGSIKTINEYTFENMARRHVEVFGKK